MSFLDKIKKSDLEEFLKETSLYCVIDVKRIYDVTINLLKKFEGKKEITDESVREWKKLYDDWYYSLETNNPDYRVYSDAHYMSEVWLCWTKYSRRYLKDLLNKKSIKINNEYKTVIEFFGKNDVIIDLGCGFGYTTATLKEIWPNSVVYGTNIKDSVQFKFATELGKKYNFSIIEDFKNIKADTIFATEYFEHFYEPIVHLEEVLLNIKPSNLIIANSFGPKAIGHFDKYLYDGRLIPSKEMNKIFSSKLKQFGYVKIKTSFWNNRPSIWKKQSCTLNDFLEENK